MPPGEGSEADIPPPARASADALIVSAAAALFGFALTFFCIEDLDWWWYLGVGRWILEHGFPTTEPFSFTAAGEPYRAEHWLSEVLFYLTCRVGGTAALVTLKALLFAGIAGALAWIGARRVHPALALLVVALALVGSLQQMRLRLLILTPALAVAQVTLLERWRATGRGLWWQIPFACLWINLHGSGPLAIAILGAYLLAEMLVRDWNRAKSLSLVLAFSTFATIITPYGWGLWSEAIAHAVTERHHLLIREFLPLRTAPLWIQGIVALFAVLIAIGVIRNQRRRPPPLSPPPILGEGESEVSARAWHAKPTGTACSAPTVRHLGLLITSLALLFLCITARRHTSLFLFPATLLVFHLFTRREGGLDNAKIRTRWMTWATSLALVFISLLLLTDRLYLLMNSDRRAGWSIQRGRVPEEALAQLEALGLTGRLFTTYENGGLVIARAPHRPVFIDNRYRPFEAILGDYAGVAQAAPGWEQTLDRWEIDLALIDPPLRGIIAAMHASPRWKLAVLTGDGCVFIRATSAPDFVPLDPRAAANAWLATHPSPSAPFPWQAPPPERERRRLMVMAHALGVDPGPLR